MHAQQATSVQNKDGVTPAAIRGASLQSRSEPAPPELNDRLEADEFAEATMRMPDAPLVQRKCATSDEQRAPSQRQSKPFIESRSATGLTGPGAHTRSGPGQIDKPLVLQRKEVPTDKDIRGPQDWTTDDRSNDVKRWKDACLTNLNAVDSSQYMRIVERRDFYKWFYELTASKGYSTRWALAASVVAHGAHQVADMDESFVNALANKELGLASVELRGDMREGNQVIFDNVLPKLKKLLDGGPLKGAAALKWDMQVLGEEQTLIQPMYAKMSKTSLAQLDAIARKSGIIGIAASITGEDEIAKLPHSKAGTVPEFSGSSLTDIGARWAYGMMLGDVFTPGGTGFKSGTKMPSVSADYTGGKEFTKVDTRSNLHQLDAWFTSDADTRVGPGSDVAAIIAKLTESEKQRIVSSRGPGDMPYAELFADAKSVVTPGMIKKAMPTDPAFAAAVTQFWKDYAAASRSVLQDLEDLYDTGKALYDLGSALWDL